MNGPPRLLNSSRSAVARDLLRAGLAERPRGAALRGAVVALGVSASAMASTTTTVASTATVATASTAIVVLKSLAVGTLVGLTLASGATLTGSLVSSTPTAPATLPSSVRPLVAAPIEAPATSPRSLPSSTTSAPAATSTSPTTSPPGATQGSTPSPRAPASARLPAAQSLSREIALIDGARRALTAGDGAEALRLLDEHDRRARTGTLDREAQLLRIDALAATGKRERARVIAERYLASYPNDPHAARLNALLAVP